MVYVTGDIVYSKRIKKNQENIGTLGYKSYGHQRTSKNNKYLGGKCGIDSYCFILPIIVSLCCYNIINYF